MKRTKAISRLLVFVLVLSMALTMGVVGCKKGGGEQAALQKQGDEIKAKLPPEVLSLIDPNLKANEVVLVADINSSLENQYFLMLNKMFRLLGPVYGVKVKSYNASWAVEKQWEAIEDAISAGAKGVFICPQQDAAAAPMFSRLHGAGVKAACDILDYSNLGVPSFGQSNYDANFAAGQYVGDYVNANFGGVAKVVSLHFGRRHKSTIDRENGFMDGLKSKVSDVRVVAEENGEAVMDTSMEKMENIITRTRDFNVVWGVNDPTALGAMAAVEAAGIPADKVIIAGFDASSDFLEAVAKGGPFKVSPGIDPLATAAGEMAAVIRMINGESVEMKYTDIPVRVVTAENAAAWKAYMFDWWPQVDSLIPQ